MHVLVTAGPTREYLDDVRFLSNASSGRMGYAIADAARRRGWTVTLVSGPVAIKPPYGVLLRRVTSASQMLTACIDAWPDVSGIIAVAAVADYRPAQRLPGKHHRSDESLHLELVPNPDILAELCRHRTHQWAVGFAVESDQLIERARAKLIAKHCDAIVANDSAAMEANTTRIQILARNGAVALNYEGPKSIAAKKIIDWIATHFVENKLGME